MVGKEEEDKDNKDEKRFRYRLGNSLIRLHDDNDGSGNKKIEKREWETKKENDLSK